MAQFYADELVQVCFGTSKLLCHGELEQAIVDFNLKAGTFTFIDRADLKLGNHESLQNIARYMILSGALYGETLGAKKPTESELEQACNPKLKSAERQLLLKPPADKKTYFFNLKQVLQEAAISLSSERKITSTKKNGGSPDFRIYGRFISQAVFLHVQQDYIHLVRCALVGSGFRFELFTDCFISFA